MSTKTEEELEAVDYLFRPETRVKRSIGFWKPAAACYRQRHFIMGLTALAALAAVIISLTLPKEYLAASRVLPPASTGSSLAASLLSRLPSSASTLLKGEGGSYSRYLSILSSRRMYDTVVTHFDLETVYGTRGNPDAREAAIDELVSRSEFVLDDEYEFMSVQVLDRDPRRAAEMANFFVEELNRINAQLMTQSAHQYRVSIEARYKAASASLDSVMEATRAFQARHGIYDLPAQTQAYFEQLGRFRSEAVTAEIQRDALRTRLGEENDQVQSYEAIVKAAQQRYDRILRGEAGLMPVDLKNMPAVVQEYANLERERQIQVAILTAVTPVLEQARFDEARQVEAVQVVDRAIPPVRKAEPRRILIVLLTTLSAFLLTVAFVLILEWWKNNYRSFIKKLESASISGRP